MAVMHLQAYALICKHTSDTINTNKFIWGTKPIYMQDLHVTQVVNINSVIRFKIHEKNIKRLRYLKILTKFLKKLMQTLKAK